MHGERVGGGRGRLLSFFFFFSPPSGKTIHLWAFYQPAVTSWRALSFICMRRCIADEGCGYGWQRRALRGQKSGAETSPALGVKYWRVQASALVCAETLMQSLGTCLKSTLSFLCHKQNMTGLLPFVCVINSLLFFSLSRLLVVNCSSHLPLVSKQNALLFVFLGRCDWFTSL